MVTHVLKDGTKLDDITGYIVRKEAVPGFYELLRRIQKEEEEQNGDELKRKDIFIRDHGDCNYDAGDCWEHGARYGDYAGRRLANLLFVGSGALDV